MLAEKTEPSSHVRAALTRRRPVCQLCGITARVHVLVGYENDRPRILDYCIGCASHDSRGYTSPDSTPRMRIRTSAVLVVLGVLVAGVGAIGALVDVSGHAGFGWYQRLGVGLGVLVAICGGLLRVELLALSGAIVAGAAAGVDLLTDGAPHRELVEFALAFCGSCFMLVGLLLAKRTAGANKNQPV